jgi:alpha-beta hydrolase superfamily lysophospholipase
MNDPMPQVRTLAMNDGVELHVEDWLLTAQTPRRGCVLIVHGLGEHIGRYPHVARALLAAGIEVRGYDQRGFGRSPGTRGAIPRDDALLDDARTVFDHWRQDRGDQPFLFGHSMGGAVAARAVVDGVIAPRGLVLSSPAIAGRLSRLQRVALRVGRRLSPDRAVPSGLKAAYVSRDPAVVADYRGDPLNHGLITPRLAQFVVDAGARALAGAAGLQVPTLVMIGSEDRLVDVASARQFHERLPAVLRTLRVYEGCYHELFNELAAERARALSDLANWFVARAAEPVAGLRAAAHG